MKKRKTAGKKKTAGMKKTKAKTKTGKKTTKKKKPTKKVVKKTVKKTAKKTTKKKVSKKETQGKAAAGSSKPKSTSKKAKTQRSGLTAAEIRRFREELLMRRSLILGNLSRMETGALRASDQDHSVDNMADFGTDNYEQDFTLGLMENVEAVVQEIDEALDRIGKGEYGICAGCSCQIPKARLKAIPYAQFCVNCQSEMEKM